MAVSSHQNALAIAAQFQIAGELLEARPYGSGHINDTYRIESLHDHVRRRSILQRINTNIFKDPIAVMKNIERVTSHLLKSSETDSNQRHQVLELIPASSGQVWHSDEMGNYWRVYHFIEHAVSFDAVSSTHQAFEAAKAFGKFQLSLCDLPEPALHQTIPDFHNTPKRLETLKQAITNDIANRATAAASEIDYCLEHQSVASILQSADLPVRVTHNDTKLNNVLFDQQSGESICVIDLDTVMPGLTSYDFGDMVRTTTSPAAEDEINLSRVTMQFPMFEAVLRGYLSSAADFLTPEDKELLVSSCQVITFEQAIRFLTDYLNGDLYYKTSSVRHNLDRCRTQLQLLRSINQQQSAMEQLVRSI